MESEVLEILTEEKSMEEFLRRFLPRILPSGYQLDENCFIRTHEGKSHLQKSIPKKMKAYPRFPYPVRVLIVQDQDSNDCRELKAELQKLAENDGEIPVMIRIACRELENWYLGDLQAIIHALGRNRIRNIDQKRFQKDTDRLNGADELRRLVGRFPKVQTARDIGEVIEIEGNKSESFRQFVIGLQRFLA
jgi:hypothetical protein